MCEEKVIESGYESREVELKRIVREMNKQNKNDGYYWRMGRMAAWLSVEFQPNGPLGGQGIGLDVTLQGSPVAGYQQLQGLDYSLGNVFEVQNNPQVVLRPVPVMNVAPEGLVPPPLGYPVRRPGTQPLQNYQPYAGIPVANSPFNHIPAPYMPSGNPGQVGDAGGRGDEGGRDSNDSMPPLPPIVDKYVERSVSESGSGGGNGGVKETAKRMNYPGLGQRRL